MNPLYLGLLIAVIGSIKALITSVAKEKRGSNEEYQKMITDFYNQVSNMLEPGEKLEAYCGYSPCAAVTNRRLLIGEKDGIKTIPFSQIQKIRGTSFSGFRTKDPNNMLTLEVKADKKYVLGNHSEGFAQVVESLQYYLPNL